MNTLYITRTLPLFSSGVRFLINIGIGWCGILNPFNVFFLFPTNFLSELVKIPSNLKLFALDNHYHLNYLAYILISNSTKLLSKTVPSCHLPITLFLFFGLSLIYPSWNGITNLFYQCQGPKTMVDAFLSPIWIPVPEQFPFQP